MKKDKRIKYLTLSSENQYLERKSARIRPRDILQHLTAFANADGGVLVIGVEDDKSITGFKLDRANKIEDFKNISIIELKETPILVKYEVIDIKNINGEDDSILIISVEPSYDKVIKSYDGNVYLRQGDKSFKLNYNQIMQLEYDRGQRYFEDEMVSDSTLEDIDLDIIRVYRRNMDLSDDISDEEILTARNMIRNGNLTNAGILLFSKNPTKYLPQARLKFVRYDGMKAQVGTEINIIKERTFDGAIPKIITEIKEFIQVQLREFQYLDKDGIFKKMPEYPEFAWVEAIVNALTHRNYSIRGDYIKVIMFDDRLEINSPGSLPNIVTIENIINKRYSRNPRIARILSEFGWVKEMNEGVKRIYSEMEKFFLNAPTYSEPNNSVLLILENNILNRSVRISESMRKLIGSDLFDNLSKLEKEIVHYSFIKKKVTVKEISKILNKSSVYTSKSLKKLSNLNILEWHGTSKKDPTQYYTLKKQ